MKRINIKFLLLPLVFVAASCIAQDFDADRQAMVQIIEETTRQTSDYTGIQNLEPAVLEAMGSVPRHEFVPKNMREYSYRDQPLPIGIGQTISQPFIVALMTALAGLDKDSIVLEVGTGSGYQAAVLAELAKYVYTVEIIEELGQRAQATLQRLGYLNISTRIGDGYHGWKEHAPFDAIIVTAAPETVPEALLEQLKPGGKLVIPVGKQSAVQTLQVWHKNKRGKMSRTDVLPVGFVPLTRDKR